MDLVNIPYEIGSGDNTTELPINCTDPFTADIFAIAAGVATASGFLSLVACSFIIFNIFLFKKWRYFSQRLVLYLTISAALNAIATTFRRVDYENQTSAFYTNFCVFASVFSQVTSWMALNSIICIVAFLVFAAFSGKEPVKLEWVFLVITFVVPLTFNWIPFIHQAYGKAGAWCWIRTTDGNCNRFVFGEVLQQAPWYIPLYTIWTILIVMYVVVQVKLYRLRKQWTSMHDPTAEAMKAHNKRLERRVASLNFYPMTFFLLYIPQFIIRIRALFHTGEPEPILWIVSAIILPLQGGIIAVAFFLDPDTRKKLKPSDFKMAYTELWSGDKVEEYPVKADIEKSMTTEQSVAASEYSNDSTRNLFSEYNRSSS